MHMTQQQLSITKHAISAAAKSQALKAVAFSPAN
jgi:hypothetical protein